jgi:hypothetical protein
MGENEKKVFISYSWAVQEKVIELAERLLANGIEVILDVYDLKDGNDKYAFMSSVSLLTGFQTPVQTVPLRAYSVSEY